MTTRNLIIISVSILLIVILCSIPFDTTFVPEWRLQLVDKNGLACKGQVARQFCTNYTLGIHPCEGVTDDSQQADDDGYVIFPARKIRANMFYRITRPVYGLALLVANGEYGTNGYISTYGPCGSRIIDYKPGGPLPDAIVCASDE
jgi:hypothetical protein